MNSSVNNSWISNRVEQLLTLTPPPSLPTPLTPRPIIMVIPWFASLAPFSPIWTESQNGRQIWGSLWIIPDNQLVRNAVSFHDVTTTLFAWYIFSGMKRPLRFDDSLYLIKEHLSIFNNKNFTLPFTNPEKL